MKLILPSETANNKVSNMFEEEFKIASKYFDIYLFDFYDLENNNKILQKLQQSNNELIYYNGWMMNFDLYNKFYNILNDKGYKLINSPNEYINCHHFVNWYNLIKEFSPKSISLETKLLRPMIDLVLEFKKTNKNGLIIKDYVKSLKHNWNEACFIPEQANTFEVAKVVSTFLEIKNDYNDFQGGFVVREFVDLNKIGIKNNTPIFQEYRSFVLNGNIISTEEYWDDNYNCNEKPPKEFLEKIASIIFNGTKNNLFTIDSAKLKDGSWIVIEIGDGQVSSIPNKVNKKEFYKNFLNELNC